MATLDSLPPEIQFNILSYAGAFDPTLTPKHPLYALADTNRHLRSIVEEYTRGLLKQHANVTLSEKRKQSTTCRRKWFRWLADTCQVCKKRSARKAILEPTMTCCAACDRKHFPKMTMTRAITEHGLSKLDLFTPNVLHTSLAPLSVGEYFIAGCDATMISEPDVLARKKYILCRLGLKGEHSGYLRRRAMAHDRLILHMGIRYRSGCGRWVKDSPWRSEEDRVEVKGPASMRTAESRKKFIKKELDIARSALGIAGYSEKMPIEVD
ncbi:hypothetical protein BDV95DRAFT_523886 [Massariosphaeria phaeospora]|uniref:F-box domain-containing protein n=1 Tax=Massariosphaeria phaeospora TaxID=100035 RepID=A0A7C8I3G7_9PLEO|nr:hypothetical protein BDV95DRAFT_523886 [Massariosphaeria phaeospora]